MTSAGEDRNKADQDAPGSVLVPWGGAIFMLGALVLGFVWLSIPLVPTNDALNQLIDSQYQAKLLAARQEAWWLGDVLLKGGFFMWLTGLILNRLPPRATSLAPRGQDEEIK